MNYFGGRRKKAVQLSFSQSVSWARSAGSNNNFHSRVNIIPAAVGKQKGKSRGCVCNRFGRGILTDILEIQ